MKNRNGYKWILDDGPFGSLACEVSKENLRKWPSGELLVADATADDAKQDRSGRREAALRIESDLTGGPVIDTFEVRVGSPAGRILYEHLRKGHRGSADLAEHESIAWALTIEEATAILVTSDKHAAFLALAELGRCRVCHPYEFSRHLFSQHRISENQYKALMERTSKADQSIPEIPWAFQTEPLFPRL